MSPSVPSPEGASAYCPHCHLLADRDVPEGWPPVPTRCRHCRLVIGAGRARSEPSGAPGVRGTAAGVFSGQARRDAGEAPASPERVLAGIRSVARQTGERPDRLLMVDYQQVTVAEPDLPSLHDVFAAFGSWKAARRRAAEADADGLAG